MPRLGKGVEQDDGLRDVINFLVEGGELLDQAGHMGDVILDVGPFSHFGVEVLLKLVQQFAPRRSVVLVVERAPGLVGGGAWSDDRMDGGNEMLGDEGESLVLARLPLSVLLADLVVLREVIVVCLCGSCKVLSHCLWWRWITRWGDRLHRSLGRRTWAAIGIVTCDIPEVITDESKLELYGVLSPVVSRKVGKACSLNLVAASHGTDRPDECGSL